MTTKNTTHLAGEFLVAGELSRRGYPVSITMGNAKSVDIYAESKSGVLKIDAKAGRAKGNWPINKENVQGDVTIYLFICNLRYRLKTTFLLNTSSFLALILSQSTL